MFCTSCGFQLIDSPKFCPGCGTKVGSANQTPPEGKKPVSSKPASPEWKIVIDVENSERTLLTVALDEEDFRKVSMVQTVVKNVPKLLSQEAVEKAELELVGEDQPEHSAVRVSEALLNYLPLAYQRLAINQLPWPRLRFVIPVLAFLVGVLSNTLSPMGHEKVFGLQRTIHIFVNPVMLLFLWNVVVVCFFIIFHRRADALLDSKSSSQATIPSRRKECNMAEPDFPLVVQIVLRPLLRLWAIFVELPIVHEIVTTAAHARVARLFLSRYFRAFRQPIVARIETIVNISAICLAAGAIAGMYVQAVMWDYSVYWESTLIHSPEYRLMIAKILFWPAAILLGQNFPNTQIITAMAQGTGVSGSMWIHVFAITAMAYIFFPRLLLIYRTVSETRRLSAAVNTITIDFLCLREQEDSVFTDDKKSYPPPHEPLPRNILDYFALAWISTEHKCLTRNTFLIKPGRQIRPPQTSQC